MVCAGVRRKTGPEYVRSYGLVINRGQQSNVVLTINAHEFYFQSYECYIWFEAQVENAIGAAYPEALETSGDFRLIMKAHRAVRYHLHVVPTEGYKERVGACWLCTFSQPLLVINSHSFAFLSAADCVVFYSDLMRADFTFAHDGYQVP